MSGDTHATLSNREEELVRRSSVHFPTLSAEFPGLRAKPSPCFIPGNLFSNSEPSRISPLPKTIFFSPIFLSRTRPATRASSPPDPAPPTEPILKKTIHMYSLPLNCFPKSIY